MNWDEEALRGQLHSLLFNDLAEELKKRMRFCVNPDYNAVHLDTPVGECGGLGFRLVSLLKNDSLSDNQKGGMALNEIGWLVCEFVTLALDKKLNLPRPK